MFITSRKHPGQVIKDYQINFQVQNKSICIINNRNYKEYVTPVYQNLNKMYTVALKGRGVNINLDLLPGLTRYIYTK